MQRTDLAYLFVGVSAVAERRARAAVATGAHITAAVAAPAVAAIRGDAVRRADQAPRGGGRRSARRRWPDDRRARPADRRGGGRTGHLRRPGLQGAWMRPWTACSPAARPVAWSRSRSTIRRPTSCSSSILDSPAGQRFAAQLMDSRLLDELVTRLLESEELRRSVAHVSTSPEVRAALSQQTVGPCPGRDGRRARAHCDRGRHGRAGGPLAAAPASPRPAGVMEATPSTGPEATPYAGARDARDRARSSTRS